MSVTFEPSAKSIVDSRRLLYFYHVAKNGSVSRAEPALGAPQPVISRQVAKLEEELGVELLTRNGRGVSLTRYGEIMFRRTEAILGEMIGAIEELDMARRKPADRIRLAAPATFMSLYMPEAVRRFIQDRPDVELVALQALTGEIYEKLVDDKVDLGIVLVVPNKARYEAHRLLVEPMVAIVAATNPLRHQETISPDELAEHRLVVPSSKHGIRDLIDSHMRVESKLFVPHLQIDSIPLIREIVASGQHVTLLPQSTAALEFDRERFATIKLKPELRRSLFAAHAKDVRNRELIDLMVGHIADVVRERTAGLEIAA